MASPQHTAPRFQCDTTQDHGDARLAPVGELDLQTAPLLEQQLAELDRDGLTRIAIDLSGLTFIDSTGVRLILRQQTAARNGGYGFALIPGPPEVQRVFELLHLDGFLP